jgi:hypothetical protein
LGTVWIQVITEQEPEGAARSSTEENQKDLFHVLGYLLVSAGNKALPAPFFPANPEKIHLYSFLVFGIEVPNGIDLGPWRFAAAFKPFFGRGPPQGIAEYQQEDIDEEKEG